MSEVIDNRAQRIRTLKAIIKKLHAGADSGEVRESLKQLVRQTDASEIMAMEQELIAEGMPVREIQSMCDLHSQVTREVLVQVSPSGVIPGHPVDTMRRENVALTEAVDRMQSAMKRIQDCQDGTDANAALFDWRQALNDLHDVDKHYQRKEHLFFSCLERHGINGPSKVMWGKDDEFRARLKDLDSALRQPGGTLADWKALATTKGAAAAAGVREMIYKEENILLPMCLSQFTADEWDEIWTASPRYGWCLVAPREGYRPSGPAKQEQTSPSGGIQLPTGILSLDQLTAIFSTLPVDLTFVDADDRVAFFSEGPARVFARSRAIVGRKVQNCHPPRSVDVVDRILSDFREGRQNVAEFWIDFKGRFVHIRYFAVRGETGSYLGTLEVTQDVGSIRALQGERRLLEYDAPSPEVHA